jgi:hypothetical protein
VDKDPESVFGQLTGGAAGNADPQPALAHRSKSLKDRIERLGFRQAM